MSSPRSVFDCSAPKDILTIPVPQIYARLYYIKCHRYIIKDIYDNMFGHKPQWGIEELWSGSCAHRECCSYPNLVVN